MTSSMKRIIPRKYDKRVKLTEARRKKIMALKNSGKSMRQVARIFDVSHTLVGFIWNPTNYQNHLARNRTNKKNVDREAKRLTQARYQQHLKDLKAKGVIK